MERGPAEGNRITGQSSLPGVESGVLGSPSYANLLAEWLAEEETYTLVTEWDQRHPVNDDYHG